MNLSQTQVELLIESLKGDGEEAVLAELFGFYRDRLRKMVTFRMDRRLHGRIDPSDVLQEAYLDLAKKVDNLMHYEDMSVFVWMRMVVGERLLKLHRLHLATKKRDARREQPIRNGLTPDASSISLAAALVGGYSSVIEQAVRLETELTLKEKIDTLEETDREIIMLRTFEGLSNDEAAEVLGMTKYAASKRYIRAIKKLRVLLETVPGFADFST